MITSENAEEDPGNTEPADAGDGVITPLISCAAKYISTNRQITCKNTDQYRYR